mmetsp:Transcript_2656/g.10521  ORF Transcript_2656/g.10521 Transcript_2656/m.10521 type:complete len:210 (+) Transcript_2656:2048-2677(+)
MPCASCRKPSNWPMESWPRITCTVPYAMVMSVVNMERNANPRMFPYLRSSKVSNASPSWLHIPSRRLHITGPIPRSLMCCTWCTISCTCASLRLRVLLSFSAQCETCLLWRLLYSTTSGSEMAMHRVICHEKSAMVNKTAMRSRPAANPLTIRSKLALASVMSVPSAFTRKSPCMLLKSDHGSRTAFLVKFFVSKGMKSPPLGLSFPSL